MIWAKTDAGRAEIQQRAVVKERPQRNLLLLIDGKNTEERLLAGVAGIVAADFARLQELGLIAPLDATAAGGRATAGATAGAMVPTRVSAPAPAAVSAPAPAPAPAVASMPAPPPVIAAESEAPDTVPEPREVFVAKEAFVPSGLVDIDIDASGIEFAALRSNLTVMISTELGLRGVSMSMALEEAATMEELRDIARWTLKQIGDRKGADAAAEARTILFGS